MFKSQSAKAALWAICFKMQLKTIQQSTAALSHRPIQRIVTRSAEDVNPNSPIAPEQTHFGGRTLPRRHFKEEVVGVGEWEHASGEEKHGVDLGND